MGVWMAINRSGGFHDRLIRQLEPFNATISHLLFAITARKRRREADLQLFASCRQVSRALAAERVMLREALVPRRLTTSEGAHMKASLLLVCAAWRGAQQLGGLPASGNAGPAGSSSVAQMGALRRLKTGPTSAAQMGGCSSTCGAPA